MLDDFELEDLVAESTKVNEKLQGIGIFIPVPNYQAFEYLQWLFNQLYKEVDGK